MVQDVSVDRRPRRFETNALYKYNLRQIQFAIIGKYLVQNVSADKGPRLFETNIIRDKYILHFEANIWCDMSRQIEQKISSI